MLVLTPSARVIGGYWDYIFPLFKESNASLAKYGSTPTGIVLELKYKVESNVPLQSPPPPIGKTT